MASRSLRTGINSTFGAVQTITCTILFEAFYSCGHDQLSQRKYLWLTLKEAQVWRVNHLPQQCRSVLCNDLAVSIGN